MTAERILSRLDGVRQTGGGRWIARCPAHEDRHASLSIRELDDGRVLVHDFAGCSVQAVVEAVGLTMSALFPEREIAHAKGERRPIPALDILRCVAFESIVVATAAASLMAGEPLKPTDRERLEVAAARLRAAAEVARG